MTEQQVVEIDAAINTAANLPALGVALFAIASFLAYVIGSRGAWRKSLLGLTFAGLILAVLMMLGIVFGRRFFGEYEGYGWVALGGYTLILVLYVSLFVAILLEQRRGNDSPVPPVKPN